MGAAIDITIIISVAFIDYRRFIRLKPYKTDHRKNIQVIEENIAMPTIFTVPFVSIIMVLLFLCPQGCSYTRFFFIYNKTEEPLTVTAQLKVIDGLQNMKVELLPHEDDGWEYQTGCFNRYKIHNALKGIIIKNHQGCTLKFTEDEIKSIATRRDGVGMWQIVIDEELLDKCESQQEANHDPD